MEAKSARYSKKKKGWYLQKGRVRFFHHGKELIIPFIKRFFPLHETPYDFTREYTKVNAMTTGEAWKYIQKTKKAGKSYRKELVEYYLKFSFPLVNFIIIMIGISLGGVTKKSVLVLSFFIAVPIYFLYYTFVALGISMGKMGTMSPALGAWLGNIVFFGISCTLLFFRKT